ncbi:MAG: bifunctional pyr operon transcriptional regulator/uracil phosphoribosyltransferase PyrR [Candidatus Marinimicrobia bacterium]|nr:bifunctional pyr operon transcriptional regulator/uracil phosphoribosyltransferase PyrR [Candidatus Neomarinimicrobiota bacterium]
MKSIKSKLMDELRINRTLTRLSHEIIEQNPDLSTVALVGIRTRGEFLARRIHSMISEITNQSLKQGFQDVTFYRDDFRTNLGSPQVKSSEILFSLDDVHVILIDDVLYTGRTIRAAMGELFDFGRPASIQLCVLVDRGHRELPIRADYVGKNYPTSLQEHIHVHVKEVDGADEVLLMDYSEEVK